MAGVICDGGIDLLNALLAAAMAAGGYEVALYTNTHTPTTSDTLATYVEASFGGYARQALASPTDSGTTGSINLEQFAGVTFTASGLSGLPVTVQGYFIVVSGQLVGAEEFPVPLTLSVGGQGINVVPGLTYQDRSTP